MQINTFTPNAVVSNNTLTQSNKGNVLQNKQRNENIQETIEKLQEHIKNIQESDAYSEDVKKDKVKEIQDQIKDLQQLQRSKESEALQTSPENNNRTVKNYDGDTASISDLSMHLISSDAELKMTEQSMAQQKEMKGQYKVLASEIEIDKGRKVDTTKKEAQLKKLEERIEDLSGAIGSYLQAANPVSLENEPGNAENDKDNEDNINEIPSLE